MIFVTPYWRNIVREEVETILDKVRPALKADGSDVELIDVKDGVVSIRFIGDSGFGYCSLSTISLLIKSELPDVIDIVAI